MKCSHNNCFRSAGYIPYVHVHTTIDINPVFQIEVLNHPVCNGHSANGEAVKGLTEHFTSKHADEVVQLCRKAFDFYKKKNYSLAKLDETKFKVRFRKANFH